MATNKLLWFFTSLLMIAAVSCDLLSGDKKLPVPLDETMDNTGVQLQFTSMKPFDLIDGEDAQLNVQLSIIDQMSGENIKRVDLHLYYMSVNGGEIEFNEADNPIKLFELPTDHFVKTNDGKQGEYTISLKKLITNLPVEVTFEDIREGDAFGLQWRIVLESGLTATERCSETWGSFFPGESNFCSFVRIIYSLPDDLFVGNYKFIQQNEATFGAVYTSMTFEAELRVNPHDPNGRIFDAEYLGQFGFEVGKRPQPLNFRTEEDTDDNSVTLSNIVGAGMACSDIGLFVGPEREHNSHFERSDDSSFTLGITENTEGDCGASPVQVVFVVVKQ